MQRAFMDVQAAQCGYCIPGMMMRAQALLDKRPDASDADVRAGLQANLCRCGTHMRILQRRATRRRSDAKRRRATRAARRRPMTAAVGLTRRAVLAGSGALVFGFALRPALAQEGESAGASGALNLPGSLKKTPLLDSWIRVEASGQVTVLTGKAELGQGISTALVQLAAEELDMPMAAVSIQTADTGSTPDEGYTAGSHSMQDSGSAIRAAAAEVRQILVGEAAARWTLPVGSLRTHEGSVVAPDGRSLGYGALVSAALMHVDATPGPPLKRPASYALVNRPAPRLDIPAKVTGEAAYVQDLRPSGLVHARVVRPPSYGATLLTVDDAAIEALPGSSPWCGTAPSWR